TTSVTRPVIDNLLTAFMSEPDPALARDAAPTFLMIIDGMIEGNPDSVEMLLGGARAYAAYTSAFVTADEGERAALLYERAREYSFRAMSRKFPAFTELVDRPHTEFVACLDDFGKGDVEILFWTASCWASWIQANASSWDAIADLPKVESLMGRALELDEGYYYGGPHLFMGVVKTIRPPALGGKPEEARLHFEQAIEIGGGEFLMAYVLYAKQYTRLMFDRELHDRLLAKVMETPTDTVRELVLLNRIAKKSAAELLASADDYF
ncbi:TRAP transporter TatT component family protein, partial [Thermodesulfobacteriota bacterium]